MAVRKAVLLALVLAAPWRAVPAERVHFRIYTTDLLDQHTHTRTVFLKPEKRGAWNDKGGPHAAFTFGQYSQKNEAAPPPLTMSTSTMYYPPVLLKTTKYVPHPSQMHKPRPVRLVHPHQLPPTSSIIYSPHVPLLDPQGYAPLRGGPSQINQQGCGAFVEGSDRNAKGNCYVEQYENGYRDEESRKTFFGDGNTNVNTEKHGERNSQNYRNEAVYHHDGKHRAPAPAGNGHHQDEPAYHNNPAGGKDHHHGGRVKVKKYKTRSHYSDSNRIRNPVNQNNNDGTKDQNYRNEAAYHYPDKKRIPIPEKSENSLASPAAGVPPRKDVDEVEGEVAAKAVYFKPLKNGKVKFIVRPSDIKYVKVHGASHIKPGDDVKLVEITKSRKVVPGTGTKIDTVKIVENTEPLPEEDAHSEESETEGTRKVRQKSHKSKGPVKTFKNVKVREKITRLVGPKKGANSESKVNPLWVQKASDHGAESGEADDDNFDISLDADSLNDDDNDDDDGYRVNEEQAEASEVPSPMLTSHAEKLVQRVRSKGRRPRHSVKYAFAAPQSSFQDSWAAAQTEIAKKINEYWRANPGDTQTSATGTLFGSSDIKSGSSVFGSADKKLPSKTEFDSTDSKARPSFSDAKVRSSLFESPGTFDAGLTPPSFGAPFEFAVSDSSENNGKTVNDILAPSSMQKEFFPSDKNHPVANGQGKSEQAIAGGGFEHSGEEIFKEMLPLAKIIVTKDHIFKSSSPLLSKDSFGASDPDRLESDARAVPVVEESSHKRKGYKETREQQLKSWR